jgi:Putative prokaryotic signal transducing protein
MSVDASREDQGLVTLTTAPDLAAARLIQGLLQSAGIDCFIPDENLLSQASYLAGIVGGLRVQVRTADGERAQAMLDDYRTSDEPADDENAEEPRAVAQAEGLAQRALRVAILGFILWPLPHPYALALALSALARKELTGHARRQARVAAAVSLFALVAFLVLLLSLLRLLHRRSGLPAHP